ncbi:MAG TPA: lytic transglycosylase domain-containing protein [Opitutus sp.]|nr:lytic transglycosylase domain-containing protein [Opitutus sp.]
MKRWRRATAVAVAAGLGGVTMLAEETPKQSEDAPSADDVYEQAKSLFDQYAPPELKEQFDFPTREQWDRFAAKLQQALENDDLGALAAYLPQARAALLALRAIPGYEDYADWLEERLDYIEAAQQAGASPAPPPPPKTSAPVAVRGAVVPYYDLWLKRVRARPVPPVAPALMPELRAAFAAEGVPAEIAWLAEVESTLNPKARSPAGAKGLFQLMPDTAKNLGLSTFLPDERTNPEKSARAAARYLRTLHGKFGTWPLAFAAYNAGEGRVERLLKKRGADTFAEIAPALPSETRMYVPKVCATIAVRAGVPPDRLPPPNGG